MLKWIIAATAFPLTVLVLFYVYLAIGMAEPKGLSLNGLVTSLFIPSEIRETPQVAICGALEVSRHWQECGGVCGGTYIVTYPSSASIEQIQTAINAYGAGYPQFEISVGVNRAATDEGCTVYSIRYDEDFWAD